jgi:lipid-binding SYLF domain-containing protein
MKKVFLSFAVFALVASAKEGPVERMNEAAKTFTEIMGTADKGIPQDLLDRAKCIVLVPGMKKAGFIIGGEYGKGFMVCRNNSAKGFTGPAAIKVEGGSIGAQIGGGETDVILVVMNERGAEKLMKDQFTLGGDADVMAGPVGRSAQAATDATMHAEMLAYSRSRGLFAGIALKGATLRSDSKDNEILYGHPVHHEDILSGKVPPPPSANVLYRALNKYFHGMPAGTEAPRKRPSE